MRGPGPNRECLGDGTGAFPDCANVSSDADDSNAMALAVRLIPAPTPSLGTAGMVLALVSLLAVAAASMRRG